MIVSFLMTLLFIRISYSLNGTLIFFSATIIFSPYLTWKNCLFGIRIQDIVSADKASL